MRDWKASWNHIALLVISIVLLLTVTAVTFAWMVSSPMYEAKRWQLLYQNSKDDKVLTVEKIDLNVEIYKGTKGADGIIEYTEEPLSQDTFIEQTNMVPSEAVYFKLVLENKSTVKSTVNISFVGIKAEDMTTKEDMTEKMSEAMYVSLSDSYGYNVTDVAPNTTYERVSDLIAYDNGVGSMLFADKLTVPPMTQTVDEAGIVIYGAIVFDRNAGIECQNCNFKIDGINVTN